MDPRPNQHRLRRRGFRIVRRGACATSHSLHRVSSSSQTRFRWALLGVYAIRYYLPINNFSILLSQRLSVKIVVTRTGFEPMLTA